MKQDGSLSKGNIDINAWWLLYPATLSTKQQFVFWFPVLQRQQAVW